MHSKVIRTMLGLALAASIVPSCVIVDRDTSARYNTTVGQELEDLEAAYDKGIITEAEYDRARARILHGN